MVLSYYALLTLIMTYPLIRNFTTHFLGDGGDTYTYIWHFWYFKQQVLQWQNPFFTDYIYFPIGASLFFTSYPLVNTMFAALLLMATLDIVVIGNVLFLLAFILSGYCAFLLVDYLTQNKWAALLAGTVYAFCPYHMAHLLGHFDLILVHWLPLFVLFFLKMNRPEGTVRQAVIAGSIAFLTAIDSAYYYAVFLIFFVGLFYLYQLRNRHSRREYADWRHVKKVLAMASTSLLLIAPIVAMAYQHARAGYYDKVEGWLGANDFVSDVSAFFLPSHLHPYWQPLVAWRYERFGSGVEGIVFIGWLVTLLTLIACVYLARRQPALRLWRFLFVAFVILSLGPTLHFNGKYVFVFDDLAISIPLPFFLVHFIPVLGHVRCPSRFAIMFMLCAAVLVGYTCSWLQQKLGKRVRTFGLIYALTTMTILIEYLSIPYPLCAARITTKAFQVLAQDKTPGTILEIPLVLCDGTASRGYRDAESFSTYTQITHNKKRIGGYISRGLNKPLNYIEQFPVIRNILDLEEGKAVPLEELDNDRQSLPELIRKTALKYIVVYPGHHNTAYFDYVAKVFNLRGPIFQDEEGYFIRLCSAGPRRYRKHYRP
ncbi:MAG: hypothetical protein HY232_03250 [Acidobacteria bacterium]|nr:hypothetical protein [Acidobacteriota bacterium]